MLTQISYSRQTENRRTIPESETLGLAEVLFIVCHASARGADELGRIHQRFDFIDIKVAGTARQRAHLVFPAAHHPAFSTHNILLFSRRVIGDLKDIV